MEIIIYYGNNALSMPPEPDNDITTITVLRPTKDRIDKFKKHPRQTYDEVLNDMMDTLEEKS